MLLNKNKIISTNDWIFNSEFNNQEIYNWKHSTVLHNGYSFKMYINKDTGYTEIKEIGHVREDLIFRGYLLCLSDLKKITYLCRLN